jgi:hypothetical protein
VRGQQRLTPVQFPKYYFSLRLNSRVLIDFTLTGSGVVVLYLFSEKESDFNYFYFLYQNFTV